MEVVEQWRPRVSDSIVSHVMTDEPDFTDNRFGKTKSISYLSKFKAIKPYFKTRRKL